MGEAHAHPKYVQVWFILLILLCVSIAGPMLGNPWITIITAFGIAVVKSLMVAANFMHLKFEKKIVWYLLIVSISFLGILFFGVASDIMKTEGQQWKDCIADNTCVEQRL